MNVYICLPEKEYLSYDNNNTQKLTEYLNKYFDNPEVKVVGLRELEKVTIVAMDKPKYTSFNKEIILDVANIIGVNPNDVYLKTNYAKMDPNYNPVTNITSKKDPLKDELNYEKLSYNYVAVNPRFSFDNIVLSEETLQAINKSIGIIEVEHIVFDDWGLREMIPEATAALNFFGPPGTGKTLAAEAIAHKLGKKIIKASYADIESKYVGEGPKMVKAIFMAAEREDAVLFLDESDSLLSKRLTNVSDGSAQSINSMRSQLLICLENFKGIVIFASNLVVNYDKAFLSRLINIEFKMPNATEREKIWWKHLKTSKIHVPLDNDVDISFLSKEYEFSGRQIKNAVKNACVTAALNKQQFVKQSDFIRACLDVKNDADNVKNATDLS